MRFGSVCSGIEAASVAWRPLGWRASFLSEIEPFPCAVLAHHHPEAPNRGDMTRFANWPDATLDLLVGGTPCQSFSVAGLRKGLADPRGNLMLTYGAIAAKYRPRWLVWENVPGVLSSNGGRDFGAFLGMLAELGYGFAYRVLDAQYFGLAQRRKRVFVVGCLGGWRRAAAVLLERSSLRGDPAPSRQAGQRVAPPIGDCSNGGGANGPGRADSADSLIPERERALTTSNQRIDAETETLIPVAHALRADGFDASEDGTGRGTPLVPVAFSSKDFGADASADLAPTLRAMPHDGSHPNGGGQLAVAFDARQSDVIQYGDKSGPLDTDGHTIAVAVDAFNAAIDGQSTHTLCADAGPHGVPHALASMQVRRLTPRECERLQGFPDDYTLIQYRNKPAADGPRYKALGNSMAVPVMSWIGRRIAMVDAIETQERAA